jgi:6-pyruvoyltetrahydropterin/6-carboxytetrahydropterin synthase
LLVAGCWLLDVKMYSVTKTITFCYGHRLLNYEGKCRYLHGHNGAVEIELSSGRLDRRGMVRDFAEIKHLTQGWIDAELDHKMILCRKDPAAPLLRKLREPLYLIDDNPTAECLAKLIFIHARRMELPVASVRLWETASSFATYSLDSPQGHSTGARSGLRLAARGVARRRRRKTSRLVRSMSTAA